MGGQKWLKNIGHHLCMFPWAVSVIRFADFWYQIKEVRTIKLNFVNNFLTYLENLGIAPSLWEDIGVTTDSPSGGGLGPVGIKENSGFCSFRSSKRGKPIPGLAQFTFESSPLKASATGETKFSEGKMHSLHIWQV